ncbi:hypothetical protein ACFX13_025131 [Malus domestica]
MMKWVLEIGEGVPAGDRFDGGVFDEVLTGWKGSQSEGPTLLDSAVTQPSRGRGAGSWRGRDGVVVSIYGGR